MTGIRVLGLPIELPQAMVNRAFADLAALARVARRAPVELERMLELGEEIARIGREVLALGEALDRRADAMIALGKRLDERAGSILALGERLEERGGSIVALGERLDEQGAELAALGGRMSEVGKRIDSRGVEIVEGATRVAQTGDELITVLPALERAVAMATPLEGAIDRFGRLVDRLPGGVARRREDAGAETEREIGSGDGEAEDEIRPAGPQPGGSSLR